MMSWPDWLTIALIVAMVAVIIGPAVWQLTRRPVAPRFMPAVGALGGGIAVIGLLVACAGDEGTATNPDSLDPVATTEPESIEAPPSVGIAAPIPSEAVDAFDVGDGAVAVRVSGESTAAVSSLNLQIVTFVRVSPSEDWWVSGAIEADPHGSWRSEIFLGNRDVAAVVGDRFEVIAAALDVDPETLPRPLSDEALDPIARSEAISFTIGSIEPRPQLAITTPGNGAEMAVEIWEWSVTFHITGSSTGLAEGDLVVVLLRQTEPPSGYWSSRRPVVVGADGSWDTQLFIGNQAWDTRGPGVRGQRFVWQGFRYEAVAVFSDVDVDQLQPRYDDVGVLAPIAQSKVVEFVIGSIESPPRVEITSPAGSEVVVAEPVEAASAMFDVAGTSTPLADDEFIVVLIRRTNPPSEGWWPAAPVAVDPDGTWNAQVVVGSVGAPVETGHAFELVALATSTEPQAHDPPFAKPEDLERRRFPNPVAVTVEMAVPDFSVSINAERGGLIAAATCRQFSFEVRGDSTGITGDGWGIVVLARPAPGDGPWTATTGAMVSPDGAWTAPMVIAPSGPNQEAGDLVEVVAVIARPGSAPDTVTDLRRLDSRAESAPVQMLISDIEGEPTGRPVLLEGEDGISSGSVKNRGDNASAGYTVLLHDGDNVEFVFDVCEPTELAVRIRYSNDNYDDRPRERVTVLFDGDALGEFVAEDTGGGGHGWDQFVASPVFLTHADPGEHRFTIAVSGGDGGGVEIDALVEL